MIGNPFRTVFHFFSPFSVRQKSRGPSAEVISPSGAGTSADADADACASADTGTHTTAGTGAPMPIPTPPLFRRTAESAPPPDFKKSFSILLSVNSNVIATFDIVLTHFICCTGPTPFVFIYRRKHGSYRRKRSSYRWERSSAPFNGSTPLTL